MGLKKGQCNNVNGRPVGAVGKANQDIKQWVKSLLETNQAQFNEDLLAIDPMQRLQIMSSLLRFAIPTLSSVSATDLIETEYQHLQKLLDDASPQVIDQLSAKIIELSEKNNTNI